MTPLEPAVLSRAARVLVTAMMDAGASAEIAKLLIASGRLAGTDPLYAERVSTVTGRFVQAAEELLETALQEAIETDEGFLSDIRRWFERPQDSYTIEEIASVLRITVDDAMDIYHDELGDDTRPTVVGWADALVTAAEYGLLRPYDIERALGADFVEARSGEAWRTVPILIRIPRWVADAIRREPVIPPKLGVSQRVELILLEQAQSASQCAVRDCENE
ncbi:MAG TPA: hypothetical protein VGD79_06425 [Thermoanaerobaculia bacterium]